jgi:hypothetical protein
VNVGSSGRCLTVAAATVPRTSLSAADVASRRGGE